MKLILLPGVFIFMVVLSAAQAPAVVKAVAGTITEPDSKDQEGWKSNEWNGIFFYQGKGSSTKLCVTDGTNPGTQYLTDIGSGTVVATIPAQDFMYIITNRLASFSPFAYEAQIWKSNGTAAGTALVYTMPQAGISNSCIWTSDRDSKRNFSVSGNTLFFNGYDAVNGNELWVTDGTALGTHIVKDINSGTGSSSPMAFCRMGSDIFFTAIESIGRKLWKTDGTSAGTVQIAVAEPFFILDNAVGIVNNKMIFYAHNTVDGYEPYVSDGTAAGTFMLANINPLGNSWLTQSQNIHLRFNSKYCFFIANNGSANALWRTDGTSAGTLQLTTNAQAAFSGVSGGSYSDVDETGLWMIEYNSSGSGNNEKLYRSDGTAAGTYLVRPGLSYAQYIKIYKGALWMAARNIGAAANTEPWRSGGNAATTNKAFEIEPGNSGSPTFTELSSSPYGFFVKNNKLFFFASTSIPSGHNLYQYNGDFTFNGSLAGGIWSDSTNWNGAMPPGITDTVFVNNGTPNALNINGANAYAGVLNIGNSATINFVNVTDSLMVNTKLVAGTNTNVTGNGILALKNIQNDTLQVTNGFTANNTAIQSHTNLVNGTVTINNNINLTGGKLFLNNNNLILAGNTSSANATSNAYITTNGTGSVQIQNIGAGARTGTVNFPIGTISHYSPINMINAGTSDVFTARAVNNIYVSYSGETPGAQQYVEGAVANTWFINEGTAGGSDVTLNLQWNAAQELPGFDRSQAILGHYTGGAWNLGSPGNASGTGPYNYTRTNISSFSPFGIRNAGVVVPLKFISFTVQKCNNGQVCLNWKTANEQNVSHFEIERSEDGIHFIRIGNIAAQNQTTANYSFTDQMVNTLASKYYYRVKQIDGDGKWSYTTTQLITMDKNALMAVYPNPAKNQIAITNGQEVKMMRLFSTAGKLIKEQTAGQPQMNIQELPIGVYLLKILLKSNETLTIKILKQ